MAEKKKSYQYFTFILYPDEFPSSSIRDLVSLGTMMCSPLHTPSVEERNDLSYTNSLKTVGYSLSLFGLSDGLKNHFHVICKSGNKITENAFVKKVCDLLHNDLRGISINPSNCGVADPDMLIRYFWHLDHPGKQQFDFDLFTLDIPKNFFKECRSAFSIEIDILIQAMFENCDSLNSLHISFRHSPFLSWVFWNSKNTYLISQLYKEQREISRKVGM